MVPIFKAPRDLGAPALLGRLVGQGLEGASPDRAGQGCLEYRERQVEAARDVGLVEVEQQPQEVEGEVVAQVHHGQQHALGRGQPGLVAGPDGALALGPREPLALGFEPEGCEGLEDDVEQFGRQAGEVVQGAGATLEPGDGEHRKEPIPPPTPLSRNRS
jgi:hypothetical protein